MKNERVTTTNLWLFLTGIIDRLQSSVFNSCISDGKSNDSSSHFFSCFSNASILHRSVVITWIRGLEQKLDKTRRLALARSELEGYTYDE